MQLPCNFSEVSLGAGRSLLLPALPCPGSQASGQAKGSGCRSQGQQSPGHTRKEPSGGPEPGAVADPSLPGLLVFPGAGLGQGAGVPGVWKGLLNCLGQPDGDKGVTGQVLLVQPSFFRGHLRSAAHSQCRASPPVALLPPDAPCRFAGLSAFLR